MTNILKSGKEAPSMGTTGRRGAKSVKTTDSVPATRYSFSLGSLKSSRPRTEEDVKVTIAQGRFAELKPKQAG